MVDGKDPLVAAVHDPMSKIIRSHIRWFREQMPEWFDLRGANIGNLILTGGFLNQNRQVDPVVFLFSKLVEVRGVVRPVASSDLHLCAELESGEVMVGQHLLTQRGEGGIRSPVRNVFLTKQVNRPKPVSLALQGKVRDLVRSAEAICYPMGSFYSSLIASLLPVGIGETIADMSVPKVYIPNRGDDPEQLGMSLARSVETLIKYLRVGCSKHVEPRDLVQFVLVDQQRSGVGEPELDSIRKLGIDVIDVSLVTHQSGPRWDAARLSEVLVSLV
jgi:CofD-related protein of GAK system